MRFSPATKCFYPESVRYVPGTLPEDLITISDDDCRRALSRPSNTDFSFIDGQLVVAPIAGVPTAEQLDAVALKDQALAMLRDSDITVIRCMERGVPVPALWVQYRVELRAAVNGERSTLPTTPDFPMGT
jgi:hypothetical protein